MIKNCKRNKTAKTINEWHKSENKRQIASASCDGRHVKLVYLDQTIPRKRCAFCYIELIVALAIVAILSALASPSLIKRMENARAEAVKRNTETLCNAVHDYMLRHDMKQISWGEVRTYSRMQELETLINGGFSGCQVAGYSIDLTGLDACYMSVVTFRGVSPDSIYTPLK